MARILRISGLEELNYDPDITKMRGSFMNVGERCNVAGSKMFINAVKDGDFDKALRIARN